MWCWLNFSFWLQPEASGRLPSDFGWREWSEQLGARRVCETYPVLSTNEAMEMTINGKCSWQCMLDLFMWICQDLFPCFHVSAWHWIHWIPWEFASDKNHARSTGRFGTAAEQQPTLPLGLGCFGDLIFVTFKSNIRGNISSKHMGKQRHLGKEMVGKQLWHTQTRRILRCFGDFSCTSEAIWMLLRALARLQFIELCPKGTDLIIVSIPIIF